MATVIDQSRTVDEANIDQIVSNQRVRGYRTGTTAGANATAGPSGVQGTMWMQGTGIATSFANSVASTTYNSTALGGGIIIRATSAATTDSTDTAANIYSYMSNNSAGVNVGDILQCMVANTGNSTLSITPGATVSLDANGAGTIPTNTSRTLTFRCTATATPGFILYM